MRKYTLWATTVEHDVYIYDENSSCDQHIGQGEDWYLADEADAALAAKDQRISELNIELNEVCEERDTERCAVTNRNQRIAELESDVVILKTAKTNLHEGVREVQAENRRLRAERVSDEILDDYIHIIKYGFGCRKLHQIGRDEAQAILNLRRANVKRDGEDAS